MMRIILLGLRTIYRITGVFTYFGACRLHRLECHEIRTGAVMVDSE